MIKQFLGLFFCLILFNVSVAQNKAIRISNEELKREVFIKNNKRLRVKTIYGNKLSGRLEIVDDDKVSVGGIVIRLEDLQMIKRNPLITSLSTSVLLFCPGVLFLVGGVILIASGDEDVEKAGFVFAAVGVGFGYLAAVSPNFFKGYKKHRNWKFEIIEIGQ